MNEFDIKASGWDQNPMHRDRSMAIAEQIKKLIPLTKQMTALEFGAGTGITSFLLTDYLKEIILMDTSQEMLNVINNKIEASGAKNIHPLFFDLEKAAYSESSYDLVFSQMVLHHIDDIENIISRFYQMLNPGGYLAISDLFPEDGSFHGEEFSGHKGFNPEELSKLLIKSGFSNISYLKCYTIEKRISDDENKHYDVFLIIAEVPAVIQKKL